ncbi:unnamed protein product [Protopolystoma xenopodis]|uniref:C2H2-type domain-containing protein n=1 Tax=Protopolystoma xenopodis TaxID=117903 RepID=A0A3S5A2T1_9PLAT|nr:unnamed protein product [Protopolystoma xenopodis]
MCVDTSLESGSTRCSRDRVPTPATVLTKSSLSDSAPSVHDWRNDQLSGRYGDKFSPSLRLADRMDVGTSAGRSVGAAPPMPAHLPPPAQTSIAAVWPPTTQECGDADALQGAEGSRHLLLGQTRADVDPATGSGSALTFYQALMTQHLQTLLKPEFAALHSQTNTTVASAHSGHFHLQPMPSVENMYHQNPTTGYTAVPPYYGAAVLSPRRRQTNGEPASCHDTGVPEATSTPVAEWRRPPTSSASQTCRNSTIPKMTDICLSSSPCSASSSSSSSSSSSPSSSSASSSTALTPPPRQLLGPCHSNSLLSTSGNITLVPGSSTNTLTTSKNSRLACATPATPRSDCWADLEVNLGQNTDADAANVAKEMVKSAGIIPGSHSNGVCRKVCDKVGISSLTGELATCAVGHFTCRVCAKAYTQASALKMHIRTHTLPCRCERCGKSFSRKWLLKGHERTHTGERPYHCQLCSRSFADRSNLRAHMQTHQRDKRYRCPTCPRSFSRMGLLNKHLSHTHRHMPTGQHMIPGLSLTLVSSKSTI